jgi:hypothetical protein
MRQCLRQPGKFGRPFVVNCGKHVVSHQSRDRGGAAGSRL